MNPFPIIVAVAISVLWSKQVLSQEASAVQKHSDAQQAINEELVAFLLERKAYKSSNELLKDVALYQSYLRR